MSGSLVQTQCPRCQQQGKKISGHRAVCVPCSMELRHVYQFCWACRREWPHQGVTGGDSCTLPGCEIRAALLSPETITDCRSSVLGCPFFRACPGCKALLTHTGRGCPRIVCPHCLTPFCFRCLRRLCSRCTLVDNNASLRALGL